MPVTSLVSGVLYGLLSFIFGSNTCLLMVVIRYFVDSSSLPTKTTQMNETVKEMSTEGEHKPREECNTFMVTKIVRDRKRIPLMTERGSLE